MKHLIIMYFFSWDKVINIANNKMKLMLLKVIDKVVYYKDTVVKKP